MWNFNLPKSSHNRQLFIRHQRNFQREASMLVTDVEDEMYGDNFGMLVTISRF